MPNERNAVSLIATRLPYAVRRLAYISSDGESPLVDADLRGSQVYAAALDADFDSVKFDIPVDGLWIDAPEADANTLRIALEVWPPALSEWGFLWITLHPTVDAEQLFAATDFRLWTSQTLPDSAQLVQAVFEEYSAVEHAYALMDEGRPDWAFDLLDGLPDEALPDAIAQMEAAVAMQVALLGWPADTSNAPLLRRFSRSQQQFYKAVYIYPLLHSAYVCQGEFWLKLGRPDMTRRLLRSIQHASPRVEVEDRLEHIPESRDIVDTEPSLPNWDPAFRPRILILTYADSDSGMDVLYDGLCRILGAERLQEYPYKPVLHGQSGGRHPSACCHPGQAQSLETLEAELRVGTYDCILFADALRRTPRDEILRLIHANPKTPVVVYDTWDDCNDLHEELRQHLELDAFSGFFKREMLAGVSYASDTRPLPLAYSDGRVPARFPTERQHQVFFAGNRVFGLRRLYLEHIEEALTCSFADEFAPEEYAARLDESRIGLDFFGFGFDTVRYWELPAHGCMLLAERKPIRLPYNFQDGVCAVFFDDLPELEEKLQYYLAHPAEATRIAEAGHQHFLKHHTASARARQFLAQIQQRIGSHNPEGDLG